MTLNGEIALILRYFTEFVSFRDALRKSGQIGERAGQAQARRPRCKHWHRHEPT